MRSHVAKTVSAYYSVLRQLRTIRRSVSRSVLQSLVSSLVLSRLDYGNSTLARVSSHSNNQSFCTSVYTGPHLHTLLTSFVRWQMSRLVSDSVPVHLHHGLSAAPDSLPSVTELSRSPLHVSGTVCQILSLPHLL